MANAKREGRGRARAPKIKLVRARPIDGHVGARVKQRRLMVGLSQQALGGKLGITFQQLQKNERGINRIGSSRLFDLSRILSVPIQYFFDDMPRALAATACADRSGDARAHPKIGDDPFVHKETIDLVRVYSKIKDPRVRLRIRHLAKSLAADAD